MISITICAQKEFKGPDRARSLFRVGLDGKGLKRLARDYIGGIYYQRNSLLAGQLHYDDFNKGIADPFCIINDVIYFISEKGIARIDIDGSHKQVISNNKYGTAILEGDFIYYSEWWQEPNQKNAYSATGPTYRVKLTGGKPQKLTAGYSGIVLADQGWVYILTSGTPSSLVRFKATDPSKKEIVIQGKQTDRRVMLNGTKNTAI
ncbi:DUF5050 domain-containing protein [Paenibacillus sp. MMS18-CY102]|uniref:DUF5050 domain-containing protein n=1 Tax=Paenibacillus sp. MMS18-CY102 TaxID=2682849 RepID=UPI0013663549|nr:DUF5050 domain-containing protein [Paenibacillus sp. MMS18-CY102]MWC27160.1 DUF5050 domain-containing protein [Paenibacillus sp. MMS18-CY102]